MIQEIELLLQELIKDKMLGKYSNEDILSVAYRTDIFQYGGKQEVYKHIDVDLSFGDYIEIHEEEPVYQYLFRLFNLHTRNTEEEQEIILYQ